MSSLYEMTEDMKRIMEILDNAEAEGVEDDERIKEAEELKKLVELAIEDKCDNIAYIIKNYEADISSVAEEINRLRKVKQRNESQLKSLKERVVSAMVLLGKKNISTSIGKLSTRRSESVEVYGDIKELPEEFKRLKIEVSPDKTALKKAIKDGMHIDGVELVENLNLSIR